MQGTCKNIPSLGRIVVAIGQTESLCREKATIQRSSPKEALWFGKIFRGKPGIKTEFKGSSAGGLAAYPTNNQNAQNPHPRTFCSPLLKSFWRILSKPNLPIFSPFS
jgi:hypothetical protein